MADTHSLWTEASPPRSGDRLANLKKLDVCIVGGGIAGLLTAYELLREGRSVTVLESKDEIGGAETAHTSAHLSSVIDDGFARVEAVRGLEVSKLAYASHADAITLIEDISQRENITCDFKRLDGYLFVADGRDPQTLEDEEAAAIRAGVLVERHNQLPGQSFRGGACLRYQNQARFHPLKFMAGLAKAVREQGGRILTNVKVTGLTGGPMVHVKLDGDREFQANQVVVATNSPVHTTFSYHTKLAAYTTYVISADVPAGSVRDALMWDTQDPYHYVRLQPAETPGGPDQLIVGGEDHKTGQADDQDDRWAKLEEWARKRCPETGAVTHRWSGQVFETLDGLAFIGPDAGGAENVYVVTGDSGMGLTHAGVAARLLTDLMVGRKSDLADAYSPSRLNVRAARTYVEENFNVALQYADWVTRGDVADVAEIKPGCGAVVRRGLTKHAVYRDDAGALHEMTAVCPHLMGLVRWNPGEKTWDCPCHGSRFAPEGDVIHGPATTGLKQIEVKAT